MLLQQQINDENNKKANDKTSAKEKYKQIQFYA
jgi:hypothetical protein